METAVTIAVAILLTQFVATEASYQRAKRKGEDVRFPVGIGLRLVLRAGGPFAIYIGYKMLEQASSTFDQALGVVFMLFAPVFIVFVDPGEIRATHKGLLKRRLLGLRNTLIPWDVAYARHTPALNEVLVVSRNGHATITHSQYHVGQEEFLEVLAQHGVAIV
jgi:hypothetical protein